MKTPRLPALGIATLVLAASLLSGCGKSDSSASAASPPVTNAATATAGAPALHTTGPGGRMRALFNQLGLTDAQKQQIAQIRQTITDRQQRREAILNVLTPDQRTKLQQLRATQSPNAPSTNAPGTPPPNGT